MLEESTTELVTTLNSILVIFTPLSSMKWVIDNVFKFHSGYIYTISESSSGANSRNFKFHSGYIYTR